MQETKVGGEFKDERDPSIPEKIREINDLIRKAQNKNGSISRTTRDEAILTLCKRFKWLIKKTANRVYRVANQIPLDEWEHETVTTFIELVLTDYHLKEDGGSAFFGHYVVTKLYYRMLDKSQRAIRHYQRTGVFDPAQEDEIRRNKNRPSGRNRPGVPVHFYSSNNEIMDIGIGIDGHTRREKPVLAPVEVIAGVINSFYCAGADEPVVEEDHRAQIVAEFEFVMGIAQRVLSKRELDIFEAYYASGLTAKEIKEIYEPNVTLSRIRFIAYGAREKVLIELGRQRIGKTLS